jgi:hypothetical protein
VNLALVPPHHGLDRRSRRARQRAAAERSTPHSIEFEQRVLAIGLCPWSSQDTATPLVREHGVRPEHFFRVAYRGPWRAIVELVESGTKPSTVLVDARLTHAEREEIRGVAGLSHLCDGVPRPDAGQLRAYADGLKALAGRRQRLSELDATRARLMDLDDDLHGLPDADTPWRTNHPMEPIKTLRDDLSILEEPDTPMLVDGLLSLDSTAALVSAPNVGKTHLALTLAASVALNVPVLDRFAVNAPGLVVYVGMEGAAGLKSRLRAMRQAFDVKADKRIGIYFWTDAYRSSTTRMFRR